LHTFQQFDISAKRRVRKLLDRNASAGALRHFVRKHGCAGTELRLDWKDIADTQGMSGRRAGSPD
jgi:Fe-S cluster assembly iron-binding protein IscA